MDHPALSPETAIPLRRSLAWCLSAGLATRPARHWAASSHSTFSAPWGLQAFLRANLWIQAPTGLQIKSSLSMTAGKSGVGVTSFPLLKRHDAFPPADPQRPPHSWHSIAAVLMAPPQSLPRGVKRLAQGLTAGL